MVDLVAEGLKELTVEPINVTMHDLAVHLLSGLPMVAQLEPGDATHYGLLLMPADSATIRDAWGRYGITPETANQYLLAVRLDSMHMHGCFVPCNDGEIRVHHVHALTENEWSRQFLAWWFNHLLEERKRHAGR